jgi:alkaline phosphatase D
VSRAILTRRGALSLAGLGACHTVAPTSLLLPRHCPDPTALERRKILALPYEKSAFPMGAMAGDIGDDRAVLWTRVRDDRRSSWGLVVIELAQRDSRVAYEGPVSVDEGGFVQHALEGLTPGARYRYSFVRTEGGRAVARGAGGRFRAAIHRDSDEPLSFGGTSCTSAQWGGEFDTLRRAALCDELAFFVHAGDHVYADEARTLEGFRAVYERTFSRVGLRALHESAGMYVVWDDHEVHNNWDGETVEPARLAAARRAFFEHHAWRGGWQRPRRLYERFSWGRTLDLFVLDTRAERRPSTRAGPEAQYLSREQLQWLIDGLRSSTAAFKCVVNSVPIARFEGLFRVAESDRWQGYPAQRQRLLEAIRDVPDVWFLSGDFHLGCVARLEPSGPDARVIEVLMGPGGQLPNPIASLLDPPQYDFATSESNWVRFDADPRARTMGVTFFNEEGRTIFERTYRSPFTTAAGSRTLRAL